MEWSNTLVLKLIDLYRERPCLWNPSDNEYKSKKRKLEAWCQLGDALQCEPVEVKKKIDSLLSSFRRERQKPETTCWFAFKRMQFLMDKFEGKQTTPTEVMNNIVFIDKAVNDLPEESEEYNSNHESEELSVVSPPIERRTPSFTSPQMYKRSLNKVCRVDETCNKLKPTCANKRFSRDDSTIYGEHIAAKHRKYNEHTKNVVEHLISNILFNADMGKYEKSHQNTMNIQSTTLYSPQSYDNSISSRDDMDELCGTPEIKHVPLFPDSDS